jgi:hypothetical protein
MTGKEQTTITLHLVRGQYDVEWHESEDALKANYKKWPPQSSGGCELRAADREHPTVWCENVSCKRKCKLHGIPGGEDNIYWYCECESVEA